MKPEDDAIDDMDALPPRGLDALSLDAALEIESILQRKADTSASFDELVTLLREPAAEGAGPSVSMLSDVRSRRILRSVLSPRLKLTEDTNEAFRAMLGKFLDEIVGGISRHDEAKLRLAKAFCLDLNRAVMTRRENNLISRHRQPQRASRPYAP